MKDQAYLSIMHAWMEEDLESAMTHLEALPTGRMGGFDSTGLSPSG